MSKAGVADVWPLSPMQQGLHFLARYDGEGPDVYLLQLVFDLEGALDAGALRRAAEELLRRHDNLRAGFRTLRSGEPVQVVPRGVELPWQEIDLSGRAGAAAEEKAAEILAADWNRRFDLARPPLLRFTLLRLGDRRHRLLFTAHHILADGWSTQLLVGELFELYRRGGDGTGLPAPPPYRDYLAWLAEQDDQKAMAEWARVLDGAEPALVAPAQAPGGSARPPRSSSSCPPTSPPRCATTPAGTATPAPPSPRGRGPSSWACSPAGRTWCAG
ncbi:condensation domain-containing protein [Actinomadura keratinilytica]|uniref:condensation domain-containing protein n=1 Tax=Actinomadura keratinilytica TaxID=547461 RepID=UPI0036222CAE